MQPSLIFSVDVVVVGTRESLVNRWGGGQARYCHLFESDYFGTLSHEMDIVATATHGLPHCSNACTKA